MSFSSFVFDLTRHGLLALAYSYKNKSKLWMFFERLMTYLASSIVTYLRRTRLCFVSFTQFEVEIFFVLSDFVEAIFCRAQNVFLTIAVQ